MGSDSRIALCAGIAGHRRRRKIAPEQRDDCGNISSLSVGLTLNTTSSWSLVVRHRITAEAQAGRDQHEPMAHDKPQHICAARSQGDTERQSHVRVARHCTPSRRTARRLPGASPEQPTELIRVVLNRSSAIAVTRTSCIVRTLMIGALGSMDCTAPQNGADQPQGINGCPRDQRGLLADDRELHAREIDFRAGRQIQRALLAQTPTTPMISRRLSLTISRFPTGSSPGNSPAPQRLR